MQGTGRTLFCFGYGYTCGWLARKLKKGGGWSIRGSTRNPAKQAALEASGIEAYQFPLSAPATALESVTHILIAAPPGEDGDPVFMEHAADMLENPSLRWIGYLSATNVYGNRSGERVDERSELRPSTTRGKNRAKAESQWRSLHDAHGLPLHIFRLAGIYGSGRSALDSVRSGTARRIDKPGHAFNRIHVEDIATVLLASMERPDPGAIYNVCDDCPAPGHEVVAYACKLLGLPEPCLIPYEEAEMTSDARSFYSDSKRVDNEKIKKELGISLLYPDYKAGLQACL